MVAKRDGIVQWDVDMCDESRNALPRRVHLNQSTDVVFFMHNPKSGGTTMSQVLRDLLPLPYCRAPAHSFNELFKERVRSLSTPLECNILAYECGTWCLQFFENNTAISNTYAMTLLRDPLSQTVSAVAHNEWQGQVQSAESKFSMPLSKTHDYEHYGYPLNLIRRHLGGAPVRALHDLFSFGILEYWNQTLCMWAWQFSLPEFEQCSCHSAPFGNVRPLLMADRQHLHHDQMSLARIQWLQRALRMDSFIYHAATQLFIRRARAIEASSGRQFLCVTDESQFNAFEEFYMREP